MKSRTTQLHLRGRQNAQQKSEAGGHPPLSSLLPFTFDASSSNGKFRSIRSRLRAIFGLDLLDRAVNYSHIRPLTVVPQHLG
jgi:hypothetical protein